MGLLATYFGFFVFVDLFSFFFLALTNGIIEDFPNDSKNQEIKTHESLRKIEV